MQLTNGTSGLCITCNNRPTCFHHARRGPAICCELFDDYLAPQARDTGLRRHAQPVMSTAAGAKDAGDDAYQGLCMNCEHRSTCGNRQALGGVWHCESYE